MTALIPEEKMNAEQLRELLDDTRESQRQRMMDFDCHYGDGFVAPRQRCGMGDFRRSNCTRHYTDAVLERGVAVYGVMRDAIEEANARPGR